MRRAHRAIILLALCVQIYKIEGEHSVCCIQWIEAPEGAPANWGTRSHSATVGIQCESKWHDFDARAAQHRPAWGTRCPGFMATFRLFDTDFSKIVQKKSSTGTLSSSSTQRDSKHASPNTRRPPKKRTSKRTLSKIISLYFMQMDIKIVLFEFTHFFELGARACVCLREFVCMHHKWKFIFKMYINFITGHIVKVKVRCAIVRMVANVVLWTVCELDANERCQQTNRLLYDVL